MKTFAAIILTPFVFVLHGFVYATLWGWFVAPTFDLPNLSIPTAIGIDLLLSLVFSGVNTGKSNKNFQEVLLFCITFPLLVLFTAWIVLQFN